MSQAPCLWADVLVDIPSLETWLHIAGLLPEGQARLFVCVERWTGTVDLTIRPVLDNSEGKAK